MCECVNGKGQSRTIGKDSPAQDSDGETNYSVEGGMYHVDQHGSSTCSMTERWRVKGMGKTVRMCVADEITVAPKTPEWVTSRLCMYA